ncbi:MAG: hypothetical protein VX438_08765 [Planctomycetota bacterium]|nr:hypothetical protein [Planctomycetota bacterium]
MIVLFLHKTPWFWTPPAETDFLDFHLIRLIFFPLLVLLITGCANWRSVFRGQNAEETTSVLQKSQMSPDSVVLEISIIKFPAKNSDDLARLFELLDVTKIDLDQRRSWDRNGLRAATSGTTLPIEFDLLLKNEVPSEDDQESTGEAKLSPRRRIQARSGKTFRIATQNVQPLLTWFSTQAGGYRVGGSKASAQTEFNVRSFSQGNGGVRLLVTPEIFHGEPKQVVTTSNSSFRYEMKRDSIKFPELRLETKLALGESLVLASNTHQQQPFGLGQTFFSRDDHRKIIVIRLAQSQKDNLFDANPNHQTLESITE